MPTTSPPDVERTSIDEGYFDLTATTKNQPLKSPRLSAAPSLND